MFSPTDLTLVQAEVVSNFVPNSLFYQLLESRGSSRQSPMRTLENRDPVRHDEALEHASARERPAFVKTQ